MLYMSVRASEEHHDRRSPRRTGRPLRGVRGCAARDCEALSSTGLDWSGLDDEPRPLAHQPAQPAGHSNALHVQGGGWAMVSCWAGSDGLSKPVLGRPRAEERGPGGAEERKL